MKVIFMNYEPLGYAGGIQRQRRKNIGNTGSDSNSMARSAGVMWLSQVFTQAFSYLGRCKLQAMSNQCLR